MMPNRLQLVLLLIAFCIAQSEQQQTLRALAQAKNRYIGSELNPSDLNDSEFSKMLGAQFDMVTPGNQMKWDATEGTRGKFTFGEAEKIVSYAQQHNMKVRGHTLMWHNQLPAWVKNIHNATELRAVLKAHIQGVAGHFKGKLYAWDVVNEIFNEDGTLRTSVFSTVMGKSFVADAFTFAHEVDPTAKLYINDYNCDGINRKSTGMYNLIKELKAAGVPIHGAGLQAHMGAGMVPHDFEQNLKRFSDLGVDVALTEMDVAIKVPTTQAAIEQQGKDYGAVFKACVDVPRCVGISLWGFTDKYSWIPGASHGATGAALIYDEHYKEKPAVAAIKAALGGH